jgi:ABC-type antimicrobial peptide transport system permease subunit
MDAMLSSTVARPRMYATLLAVFASLGAVIALIGVYGLMAYVVNQRTREIGIRGALGASPGAALRLVLAQSAVLSGIGITLGLVGAARLTRYLEGLLFGLAPLDAGTFAGVAGLFALVSLVAASVPARRAARVNPIVALRAE